MMKQTANWQLDAVFFIGGGPILKLLFLLKIHAILILSQQNVEVKTKNYLELLSH